MSVEINQTTETIIISIATAKDLSNLPIGLKTLIIGALIEDDVLNLPITLERLHISTLYRMNEEGLLNEHFEHDHIKLPYGCVFTESIDDPEITEVRGEKTKKPTLYSKITLLRKGIKASTFEEETTQYINYSPSILDVPSYFYWSNLKRLNIDVNPSNTHITISKYLVLIELH
jgi:hypothetical protein